MRDLEEIDRVATEAADAELLAQFADTTEGITRLTAPEVCVRAGIKPRVLHYWTVQGWLVPDPRMVARSGHPYKYPLEQVTKARVMADLVSVLEMAPGRASEVADLIVESGSAVVGNFVVTKRGLGR